MKETKIYADEFCTTFASTTEMLEFLAERAKQSKWIRKPTRMLKLVPLEKEAETIEEACEKELEGIVEDTEKNTQLVLKVNKDFYPVRDCAIHTILKRAGTNGTGLKKLEKATYAKVVKYCLEKGIPVTPGVVTPSEMEQAIELGLEVVKFFPAEPSGGLNMIKAVAAPYTMLKFMPTGGLNPQNITSYLQYDKIFACGGSWMVKGNLVKEGAFDEITRLTKEAVELVHTAREV